MSEVAEESKHKADEAAEGSIPAGGTETKAALIRLLLVVGAGVAAAIYTDTTKFLLVVVAVIAAIMIHELGHFIAAKRCGMKVTEYFLGFGPTLWSVKRGEIEYGVKAIPAGGYVKIIGMNNLEEVAPEDESRAYRSKAYWQKVVVAVAGPATHFVIALLLMFVALGVVGPLTPNTTVDEVRGLPNGESPAQVAGMRSGDKVVSVDGKAVDEWNSLKNYISERPGTPIVFEVQRGAERLQLTATPVTQDGSNGGIVGVTPKTEHNALPLGTAVGETFSSTGRAITETLKSIAHVFSPEGLQSYSEIVRGTSTASVEEQAQNRLMSPVGLVKAGGDAADAGPSLFLLLLVFINLFLGIFNLIPLPPFDGGHIAVATYEKIRSFRGKVHTVDYAKLMPVTYVVLLMFVTLSASALWLDITNPVPNFYKR